MEEFFNLFYTVFCQVDRFFFFIDNKVTGFFNLLAHNGVHFGKFTARFTTFQLAGKDITGLVQLRRLPALSGNDQRSSCLVDQHRIHLVDYRKMKSSLNELLFVNNHVIT